MRALAVMVPALLGGCFGNDSVFDRPWTFRFVQATISDHQADGSSWDTDNSAPDPYVALNMNGMLVGMTFTLDDTTTPQWGFGVQTPAVERGSGITMNLNDSDTFTDDVIASCSYPLTAELAAAGSGQCTTSLATLDFTVTVD